MGCKTTRLYERGYIKGKVRPSNYQLSTKTQYLIFRVESTAEKIRFHLKTRIFQHNNSHCNGKQKSQMASLQNTA